MTELTIQRPVVEPIQFEQDQINTYELRKSVIKQWTEKLNSPDAVDAIDMAYYTVARGVLSKYPQSAEEVLARLKESFTPISNKVKLQNGRHEYDTLELVIYRLLFRVVRGKSKTFDLNTEIELKIIDMLKAIIECQKSLYTAFSGKI